MIKQCLANESDPEQRTSVKQSAASPKSMQKECGGR